MSRPYSLTPLGAAIVRKGGHDDISNDELLFLELVKRMPGMTREEYHGVFVALRMEYGEDALYALQNGYVKIEETRGGARPEGEHHG